MLFEIEKTVTNVNNFPIRRRNYKSCDLICKIITIDDVRKFVCQFNYQTSSHSMIIDCLNVYEYVVNTYKCTFVVSKRSDHSFNLHSHKHKHKCLTVHAITRTIILFELRNLTKNSMKFLLIISFKPPVPTVFLFYLNLELHSFWCKFR